MNPRERRAALRRGESGVTLARELRGAMSPPEVILWQRLRGGRLAGFKFRRQHPMGPYVADFYCAEALLVVEVDGATHQGERKARDADRDRWMEANGVRVLRFTAFMVFRELDVVLGTVLRWARERTKEPPPS
jgi:very-short-patch-repair endonuclease